MIRILIVDDQSFTRRAIQAILEKETDFQVVGQAANGIEALELIKHKSPDIALVDLEMPAMNGYELTYQIAQRFAKTKVVILSACETRESIDTAIKAGAKGYLLKSTSGQEIADTIRYVQRGYFQLGPGLFEKILSNLNSAPAVTTESFEKLKAEMKGKNERVRRELFHELEIQINGLKQDFRQGLEIFQQRVSERMNQGLSSLSDRVSQGGNFDLHIWEKQINARELERQQQINRMLTGTKKSMLNLEKKVNFLRNCLIFLAVTFFAEKIAMLVF